MRTHTIANDHNFWLFLVFSLNKETYCTRVFSIETHPLICPLYISTFQIEVYVITFSRVIELLQSTSSHMAVCRVRKMIRWCITYSMDKSITLCDALYGVCICCWRCHHMLLLGFIRLHTIYREVPSERESSHKVTPKIKCVMSAKRIECEWTKKWSMT